MTRLTMSPNTDSGQAREHTPCLHAVNLEYAGMQWGLHIQRFGGVCIGVTSKCGMGLVSPLRVSPQQVATSDKEL